jgi:hypothetical protein
MALNVNDVLSVGGGFAADSPDGLDATGDGLAGGTAADGAAGLAAIAGYGPASFTGTAAGDNVVIGRNAFGQWGGDGGRGGHGGAAPLLSSDGYAINEVFGDAGAGGSGGAGGLGGSGTATIAPLTLRLGQGGLDTVTLSAGAIGGNGGDGSNGGDGGTGGGPTGRFGGKWFGTDIGILLKDDGSSEPYGTSSRTLGNGGDAGAAGAGGRGGDGVAAVGSLAGVTSVKAAAANLTVEALGQGGQGGGSRTAIDGTTVGVGDPGGDGFDGARGGDGGDGIARIEAIQASFTGASTVTLHARADGGNATGGYAAGEPYPDFPFVPAEHDVVTYSKVVEGFGNTPLLVGITGTVTYRWGEAGVGGDGGDGGDALARLAGNRLAMSGAADTVTIRAEARGGTGGAGGEGSDGRAASTTDVPNGDGYLYTIVDPGFAATADGAKGANGAARIEMVNNRVDLGAGDDTLNLTLIVTSGDGIFAPLSAATLAASGNVFLGGDGTDTLNLAGIAATNLTVDLALGLLKAGAITLGTIGGFETVIGSAGADRFVDGAGDQTYRPSAPQHPLAPGYAGPEPGDVRDTFVFAPGHGHDIIEWFDKTGPVFDRLDLRAFGPALDSAAELRAATRDVPGIGCVIDTPDGGSITLVGVARAELAAGMFLL